MQYISQFFIIMLLSFTGEFLHILIPIPIPASIYGMILMFTVLSTKIVKLEQIKDVGEFLVSILPILFVAPIVSLLDCMEKIRDHLVPILVILCVSTVVCFAVSGRVTQMCIHKEKGKDKNV